MQIERNYYKESMEMLDEIKKEEDARKARLTESEKAEEKAQMELEVQKIIQRCERERSEKYRIVVSVRMGLFQKIMQQAMWLAEQGNMDVKITTENLYGKIVFSTEAFLVNGYCPKEMRTVMVNLLETANDICFSMKNDVLNMEFIYDLFIDVDKA